MKSFLFLILFVLNVFALNVKVEHRIGTPQDGGYITTIFRNVSDFSVPLYGYSPGAITEQHGGYTLYRKNGYWDTLTVLPHSTKRCDFKNVVISHNPYTFGMALLGIGDSGFPILPSLTRLHDSLVWENPKDPPIIMTQIINYNPDIVSANDTFILTNKTSSSIESQKHLIIRNIQVTPNPFSGQAYIQISENETACLYDIRGCLLERNVKNGILKLDVTGIYFLKSSTRVLRLISR